MKWFFHIRALILAAIVAIICVLVGSGIDYCAANVTKVGVGVIEGKHYVPSQTTYHTNRFSSSRSAIPTTTTTTTPEEYIVFVKVKGELLDIETTRSIWGLPQGSEVRVYHRQGVFDWGYCVEVKK